MLRTGYLKFLSFIFFTALAHGQYDTLREYYPNGALKLLLPRYQNRVEGIGKVFYENGNLKEERTYTAGKVSGLIKQYNENGKLAATFTIDDGKREGPYTVFNADGSVNSEIYYVNGKIETPDTLEQLAAAIPEELPALPPAIKQDTTTAVKFIAPVEKKEPQKNVIEKDTVAPLLERDTVLVDMTVSGNPLLARLSQAPQPVTGWEAFHKKIIYPDYARKKKISGTVIISALLDKSGEVKTTKIIRGLGYGCDESAEIAVYYTKFLPAITGNVKKTCELIIPVEFKTTE